MNRLRIIFLLSSFTPSILFKAFEIVEHYFMRQIFHSLKTARIGTISDTVNNVASAYSRILRK